MKLQELMPPLNLNNWEWKNFGDLEAGDLFLCGSNDTMFMKLSYDHVKPSLIEGAPAVRLYDGECWTFHSTAELRAL